MWTYRTLITVAQMVLQIHSLTLCKRVDAIMPGIYTTLECYQYFELYAKINLFGELSASPGGNYSSVHSSDVASCHSFLVEMFAPQKGTLDA